MKTHFACPACRAPLVVGFVATSVSGQLPTGLSAVLCPNPFCRAELPARRDTAALVYALVGTGSDLELAEGAEPKV